MMSVTKRRFGRKALVVLAMGGAMMVAMILFSAPGDASGSAESDATIVDEWAAVKVPVAPELKAVKVDAKVTALLILDMQNQNCNP